MNAISDTQLDDMIAMMRSKSKIFDGDHVSRDAPLTSIQISQIERDYEIQLNTQYRRFLMIYGAGDFLFSQFYSVDPNSTWSLWRQSLFVDGVGKSILPFSDNGCGDYYAFLLVDGQCSDRIYLLEHELGYTVLELEYSSFNDFVAQTALSA